MLRRVRFGARLALGAALAVSSGCGGGAEPAVAPSSANNTPAEVRPEPQLVTWRDSGWERVHIARLALSLELPEAAGFRELRGSSWAKLEHRASHSRLALSVTRAERLVRPEDCEARARLEQPALPRPAEGEAVEQRRLPLPREFLSQVTVSVSEAGPSELEGHVTVFGAAVSRCLALHFATRVHGAGSASEVARRLGLVVERVLPSLELSEIDARVSPQPFPRIKRP